MCSRNIPALACRIGNRNAREWKSTRVICKINTAKAYLLSRDSGEVRWSEGELAAVGPDLFSQWRVLLAVLIGLPHRALRRMNAHFCGDGHGLLARKGLQVQDVIAACGRYRGRGKAARLVL